MFPSFQLGEKSKDCEAIGEFYFRTSFSFNRATKNAGKRLRRMNASLRPHDEYLCPLFPVL